MATKVLVVDLQSEQGKLLNGRIVDLDGPPQKESGRYPIRINMNWLSGKSEVKNVKLCNIHPFYHQPDYVDKFVCPPLLKDYTQDAKLRESHGRLLHQVLAFARFFVVRVEDLGFSGDINQLMNLPLTHPLVQKANSMVFDYWMKAPFSSSRSQHRHGTALDFVVGLIMHNAPNLEDASVQMASYSNIWSADGVGGRNMMLNFFHCMKSWEQDRVRGGFWVVDEYETGAVMVHLSDINDPESFSTVYVVKGP